jgi:anti-anti-sigma regulatory factor
MMPDQPIVSIEARGEAILADIQPKVREAFSLTRLDELFEIYATAEDALAQVGPAS